VWGFYAHIALAKPIDEVGWRRQCDLTIQTHDEGHGSEEWLFHDLTGYLERWPEGEEAGEYIIELSDLGMEFSASVAEPDQIEKASTNELQEKASKLITILYLMGVRPISEIATDPVLQRNWPSKVEIIQAGYAKIEQELSRRNGGQHAR
jgi:hypothetical protein